MQGESLYCLYHSGISRKMELLFLLLIVPLVSCDRIVTTTNGPVKGISLAPKKVEAFLGIPYAEPPVGPLRFAKPVPKSPWKETYDANELPPSCVQAPFTSSVFSHSDEMSEDCLHLNIWVPEGGSELKPIMLFIHGGGFMIGSSNWKLYDGTSLSEHGDVIVATINYRLGSLGFFYGATDEAAGSMGMYDQVMAIQWIRDNAKQFGGDPDNIVLFGESAGAFSVSLHLISPLSKDLFRRAILQSGSAINPMFTSDNEIVLTMSKEFANLLGCTEDDKSLEENPKAVVDCMKALPTEKFSEADRIFRESYEEYYWKMLTPRVGDSFLPETPVELFKKGNFKNAEVFLGVNRDEGTFLLPFIHPDLFGTAGEKAEKIKFTENSAKEYLHNLMDIGDKEENKNIFQHYFDRVRKDSGYTYLKAISEIVGDQIINCGAIFQADYQSLSDHPVYFYFFDYRPDSIPLPEWMGVAHGQELPYVFGNPLYQKFTGYEEEFSKDIMDMWVAFAKSGNPSIPGGVVWPKYSHQDPKYVVLSKTDSIRVRPDNQRCELWRKQFRALIDEDTK